MGCGTSSESPRDTHHYGHNRHEKDERPPPRDPTPPPRYVTPPPPRDPTPPPPRDPTPPPPRDPTPPPPRDPTPPPPRDPTPPPPRDPTPPPPRDPTPPPPRDPTPSPPRDPTPPPPHQSSEHPPEHAQRRQKQFDKHVEGYEDTVHGMHEKAVEFREHPEPLDRDFAEPPSEIPFTDHDFPPSLAIEGENFEWKRPREFRDNPVLFSDGTTRYDIGQGSAGTCWFLSMVAMLADRPEIFHRVVPQDAWDEEGGYFHCYFWRFGQWEDVYIDDYLPVVHGCQLWGAKSRDDENEMWPALLEKAFARFHGNYNSVYGGQSGDAFLALTGGCSEYIDFDKKLVSDEKGSKGNKAIALHNRLKSACAGDAMLTTEVPNQYDGHNGLVGGHAYSLTGAITVFNNQGEEVRLVRVRNPWGHTEWKGAWSDGSPEWGTVDTSQVQHANRDDGEFWMSLRDFIKYFSGVTVCSMKPDFDQDGKSDTIDCITTLFGQWSGASAAGFQNRIMNPRYIFCVDDTGVDDDGKVPLVVQICQFLKHRQKNKASIRVDLYKILAEKDTDKGPIAVATLLGDVTNVYKCERQMSNRYKVEPGYYAVLPSTIDAGIEKDYLVRIFSAGALSDIREMGRDYAILQSDEFKPPENVGVDTNLAFSQCLLNEWRCGTNAGGQVSSGEFYTNPQVMFEVAGGQQLVNFVLMKEPEGTEDFPIGLQIFNLEPGHPMPVDQSYLYDNYESGPRSTEGGKGAFILGTSASASYVLDPGQYFVLLHMDSDSQESRFALIVRSAQPINVQPFNFY